MSANQRIRKPTPARSGPRRSWREVFKDAPPSDSETADSQPEDNGDNAQDAVKAGVELGYRVMEEQLAVGRRFGQQWLPDGIERFVGQNLFNEDVALSMMQFYGQMFSVMLDSMAQVTKTANPSKASGNAKPARRLTKANIDIFDIDAPYPVSVDLDVTAADESELYLVHPLFSHQPGAAPAGMARLELLGDRKLRFALKFLDDAPPGHYASVVVFAATNRPAGTLCVELVE